MSKSGRLYIAMPDRVKQIIGTLRGAGFEAWAVGGCVRDSLLGRTPEDWDITTSAMPEQTKALFDREKTGSDQLPRLSTATKENRRSLEHFRRKVMPGTSRHRPMTTIFGIVKRREKHNAWR